MVIQAGRGQDRCPIETPLWPHVSIDLRLLIWGRALKLPHEARTSTACDFDLCIPANDHRHPVMRNPRRHPILTRERAQRQGEMPRVRPHNRGATVGENGAANTGVRAPFELCLNARVPYPDGSARTHEAAGQGRAIADVDVDVAERCDRIAQARHVRHVEDSRSICPQCGIRRQGR